VLKFLFLFFLPPKKELSKSCAVRPTEYKYNVYYKKIEDLAQTVTCGMDCYEIA
jgi:hypothetical protein